MAKRWLEKGDGLSISTILAHFPVGVAFLAFRISGKVASRLVAAFAREYDAAWNALYDLSRELDYRTTTFMIDEWEAAVGLPDPCFPASVSIADRKRWIAFRLTKKRWNTLQDWYDLAALFGVRVRITPGWAVQRQALFQARFPKRFDLFPKLGRFRIYIDLMDQEFGGFPYDGRSLPKHKFPLPFGTKSDFADQFKCMIDRVAPANVLIIWNEFPPVSPNGNGFTFSDDFDEEYA